MTTETAVVKAAGDSGLANSIVTLGAGIVALVFIFGFLFIMVKEFIPAFKAGVASLIEMMDKMASTLAALNKTMLETQAANTAALERLKQEVSALAIKLDYHIDMAGRIEGQVTTLGVSTSEIKERVRSCALSRDPGTRGRKEDKFG